LIQVANAGPDVAAKVVVTDNLPKGVGFVSAQSTLGSCGVSSNRRKVTCTLGTVAVNVDPQYNPVTITINVLAPSKAGTISNTASVTSDTKDPKRSNNAATATTRVVEAPAVTCQGHPATIVGTPGPDLLMGSPANDVIFAGAGNDRIVSSSGRDLICAGSGSDVIRSGAQPDRVFAGPGADRISGGAGGDILRGGRGPDRNRGGRGADLLVGGPGRDRCFGGPGRDLLRSC
jgi:Ca2+-binding RTX toxin-like protein